MIKAALSLPAMHRVRQSGRRGSLPDIAAHIGTAVHMRLQELPKQLRVEYAFRSMKLLVLFAARQNTTARPACRHQILQPEPMRPRLLYAAMPRGRPVAL